MDAVYTASISTSHYTYKINTVFKRFFIFAIKFSMYSIFTSEYNRYSVQNSLYRVFPPPDNIIMQMSGRPLVYHFLIIRTRHRVGRRAKVEMRKKKGNYYDRGKYDSSSSSLSQVFCSSTGWQYANIDNGVDVCESKPRIFDIERRERRNSPRGYRFLLFNQFLKNTTANPKPSLAFQLKMYMEFPPHLPTPIGKGEERG